VSRASVGADRRTAANTQLPCCGCRQGADKLAVKVSAPDLCGRFSGRVIRNVNTKATTPQWMVDRLARCGQRSVTALVDISNYVMFELGRPSHIFDLDKIAGGLEVRWGKPGEQLKLLNGNTVTVDEKVGVIADDVQVESLAGIMGGDATSVGPMTPSTCTSKPPSGGPSPLPGVHAASISPPMPVTVSSAVWTLS
jgi:phenylalanyl-tRNA synthetase beta subunit